MKLFTVNYHGFETRIIDVTGRIAAVANCHDVAKLRDALDTDGLQKTVRTAIERRIKLLEAK